MDKPGEIRFPTVLSIAGFDPSGGAGVLADTKTFVAFNCCPAAAITSLTFQNEQEVFGCVHQTASTVRAQLTPVLAERKVSAVKTGMLPTREIVLEVANVVREHKLPSLVVDPVIRSTSSYELANDAAISALCEELFPLARVVTPNIPEAERLTGLSITDEESMRRATLSIRKLGAQAVLLKGGHLRNAPAATDLLDDGGMVRSFSSEWIRGDNFHGTGCLLSAAIAACLAKGLALEEATRQAKNFVTNEIRRKAAA